MNIAESSLQRFYLPGLTRQGALNTLRPVVARCEHMPTELVTEDTAIQRATMREIRGHLESLTPAGRRPPWTEWRVGITLKEIVCQLPTAED